jgi:hypothetical protein
MTINLNVASNLAEVRAQFADAQDRVVKKATVRALNRALDQSQTGASREIRKTYNIKAGAVVRGMKKIRAYERSILPSATLQIRGVRISLFEFSPTQRRIRTRRGPRRGVSVKVLVGGQRKLVKGGFVATTKSGVTGIFIRQGRSRYPIRLARSVSLPQTFTNKVVLAAVKKIARDSFETNVAQQIEFLSAKK